MTDHIQLRTLVFLLLAAGIGCTALVLVGMLHSLQQPEAVAVGLTLDLTLVIPLAYYALVVRPRGWSPVAVAPVAALGFLLAAALLPADHRQTLDVLQVLALPAELGLLAWISLQTTRALKRVRGAAADPLEVMYGMTAGLPGSRRLARMFASEMAVFFYTFAAWRTSVHVASGTHPFSSHLRSGHGGLILALLIIMAAEGLAVHHLLAAWSPGLAWTVTVLTVYGALWLFADYRATVLRPVLVGQDEVCLRAGLRWYARVQRSAIVGVSRTDHGRESAISLAFGTRPNSWIRFSAPVLFEGPYGITREVLCVGLFVDSPAEFQQLLASTDEMHGAD